MSALKETRSGSAENESSRKENKNMAGVGTGDAVFPNKIPGATEIE